MQVRLKKSNVARFTPRATPFELCDRLLPGLVLRVQPTGSRTFYWTYRLAGQRSRYRLGTSPALSPDGARQLARKIAAEVADGRDPNRRRAAERADAQRRRVGTLRAFLEQRYEPWATSNLRSGAAQLERIRADFADWLDKPMCDLTPWLIETYRKHRRDAGIMPVTINREIQRLRAVAAKAVTWGVLAGHPFAAVRPLRHDKTGRVRFLSPDEERSLRAALVSREERLRVARDRFNTWRKVRHLEPLPRREEIYVDHLRPIVLVALNTGLRRGELLALTWNDVDLGGRIITVRGTSSKTGQTRRIPVNQEALDVLATWRRQAPEAGRQSHVFGGVDGVAIARVDTAWRTAITLAGLVEFRFHDLRHHFASKLVMSGVPLNTVRELLGHRSLEMTVRYAHLGPESLARAVEKLERPAA